MAYFNSACNPVIYTIFNKDFRSSFYKYVLCRSRRNRRKRTKLYLGGGEQSSGSGGSHAAAAAAASMRQLMEEHHRHQQQQTTASLGQEELVSCSSDYSASWLAIK
jgi:hypothetical protein